MTTRARGRSAPATRRATRPRTRVAGRCARRRELGVRHPPRRVQPVQRPLERHLLVGPHPGVERNGGERGLEVEIIGGRARDREGGGQIRLDLQGARTPRPAGAGLHGAEGEVVRDVGDALDAGGLEALPQVVLEPGHAEDPVGRLGRGAVVPEVTAMGPEALWTRLDDRRGGQLEHVVVRRDPGRDVRQQGGGVLAHVHPPKESRPVDAVLPPHVVGVDVHHLDRPEPHAGALEHEALERNVVQVDVSHPGAGLDLAQPPGSPGRRSRTSTRMRTPACSKAASKMAPTWGSESSARVRATASPWLQADRPPARRPRTAPGPAGRSRRPRHSDGGAPASG